MAEKICTENPGGNIKKSCEGKMKIESGQCTINTTDGDCTLCSAQSVNQKGKEGEEFGDYKPVPSKAKAVVHFRPHKEFKGEYGFDWLRQSEDVNWGYAPHAYKEIMGKCESSSEGKCVVQLDDETYETFTNTEYKHKQNFRVPWKSKENSNYRVPRLNILPGKTAKLNLVIEVKEEPLKRLKFECKPKGSLKIDFSVPCNSLQIGEHKDAGEVTVECKEPFDKEILITVTEDTDDKKKQKPLGKLIIMPNNDIPKINITFVKVYLHKDDKEKLKNLDLEQPKKWIKDECLNQALIQCEFSDKPLSLPLAERYDEIKQDFLIQEKPLTESENYRIVGAFKDSSYGESNFEKLANFLTTEFERLNPGTMHHLVYFLINVKVRYVERQNQNKYSGGGVGGLGNPYRSFIYDKFDKHTYKHEGAHSLGLHHTFTGSTRKEWGWFTFNKYTFKAHHTDNIIDYEQAHENHIKKHDGLYFWRWQWNVMRERAKNIEKYYLEKNNT